jgi:hypothetical protein
MLILALGGVIGIQAHVNQELYMNQAAETLRDVIGQTEVSELEYSAYLLAEKIRHVRHQANGRVNARVAARIEQPLVRQSPSRDASNRPRDIAPFIVSPTLKKEGKWRPLTSNAPGIWRTKIRPNALEPSEIVELIAMDLRRVRVTYVPGTEVTGENRMSEIPPQDRASVVAVFNGGFRHHELDTGQRKNGIVYRPLQNDKGTVILENAGVEIANWSNAESSKFPNADVRQNLSIFIDNGLLGQTIIGQLRALYLDFPTIRAALGQTADGRWLIFAGEFHMRPPELARALRLASCREAVLLDQNRGNVFFDVASRRQSDLEFSGINPALHLIKNRKLLTGSNRDFFYLTERAR